MGHAELFLALRRHRSLVRGEYCGYFRSAAAAAADDDNVPRCSCVCANNTATDTQNHRKKQQNGTVCCRLLCTMIMQKFISEKSAKSGL